MSERGHLSTKPSSSSGYGAVSSSSHGPEPTGPPADPFDTDDVRGWSGVKYRLREPFAEFLGTFVLCAFGIGGVVLSRGVNGSWITIAFSFGLGLTLFHHLMFVIIVRIHLM